MSTAEERLYDACAALGIIYTVFEHAAVFTV